VESLDGLRDECAARLEPMLALLEELVVINSHSHHPPGGAEVGGVLARELGAIPGIAVWRRESERFGPHLCAASRAAKASAAGSIALVGHLDTVFPPGTFESFRRDAERAYGPGVCDMKGGLVLCIEALRIVARRGLLDRLPVRFVVVSDEEVGSPEGAEVIAAELGGASCALVFETGRRGDAIVTSRKGTGGVHLRARGKAAHAGNAHESGANAIWALARVVDRVQALTAYDRGITVNVGTVKGGTGRNTVPDAAEALVDLRFVTIADGEALVAAIRRIAAAVDVPGTAVEVHGGVARPPLERTDGNVALYREVAAAAAVAGLECPEAPLQGGGSDAATTAALGIPSVDGLGPRGTHFHTHDEEVEIGTFVPRLEMLVRFLAGRARERG
jgi:glutamate carboxypeptidase